MPAKKIAGGTRYYDYAELVGLESKSMPTVGYVRVSSHDQKDDLDEQPTFEEELAQDVLEIITIFSARLYGSRSHKNKKLIKDLENAARSQNTTQAE